MVPLWTWTCSWSRGGAQPVWDLLLRNRGDSVRAGVGESPVTLPVTAKAVWLSRGPTLSFLPTGGGAWHCPNQTVPGGLVAGVLCQTLPGPATAAICTLLQGPEPGKVPQQQTGTEGAPLAGPGERQLRVCRRGSAPRGASVGSLEPTSMGREGPPQGAASPVGLGRGLRC